MLCDQTSSALFGSYWPPKSRREVLLVMSFAKTNERDNYLRIFAKQSHLGLPANQVGTHHPRGGGFVCYIRKRPRNQLPHNSLQIGKSAGDPVPVSQSCYVTYSPAPGGPRQPARLGKANFPQPATLHPRCHLPPGFAIMPTAAADGAFSDAASARAIRRNR